jgi:hypothetical protein
VTIHEVGKVVKHNKTFCLNKEYGKDFNEWNENVDVSTQIDHNSFCLNESIVPKDDGEKAILQKKLFLRTIIEECLNTEQDQSLAHPHGEIYDTYTAYHELEQQSLAFTREQLSHGTLSQYIEAMQSSGKWSGTLFNVALHWYEQIKQYMWFKLIGLLPMDSFCFIQSAVDLKIRLECMKHMDHGEHTDRRVSSTYIDVSQERHPTCSPIGRWPLTMITRQITPIQVECWQPLPGTLSGEERNSVIPDQGEPANSMLYQDRMTHIKRKWRTLHVPWTVHDVDDLVSL